MTFDGSLAGSRARPHKLQLPAAIYTQEGDVLGLRFTKEQIRRASRQDGRLGIERFEPTGQSTVKLPFLPGAYVECHISRHVI